MKSLFEHKEAKALRKWKRTKREIGFWWADGENTSLETRDRVFFVDADGDIRIYHFPIFIDDTMHRQWIL